MYRLALVVVAFPAAALASPATGVRAVQIAVGAVTSCARMSDGTVRCWGDNLEGADGDGTDVERHTPVTVKGVDHAIDLAVGQTMGCARIAGGAVKCWGSIGFIHEDDATGPEAWPEDPAKNLAHPVRELASATALWFSQDGEGCARWASGAIKCWGGGAGALATGSTEGAFTAPVRPELAGATSISLSEALGCAVMKDATVTCFGRNDNGQIGDGTTEQRLAPVAVQHLRDVAQVAVAREAACARKTDGTVWCWGGNDAGQLGDGTTAERHAPVQVKGVTDAVAIAAGEIHACALRRAGTVACWGWNRAGELGDGKTAESSGPVEVAGLDHVTQIALGFNHTCAVRDDGTAWCWGSGDRGKLGDGLQADHLTPSRVAWTFAPPPSAGLPAGVHVASVSVGGVHTCAALDDGTVRCWGRNDDGMVLPGSAQPQLARPTAVPGVAHAHKVALGMFDSSAQLDDGSVVSWGRKHAVEKLAIAPVVDLEQSDAIECALRKDATSSCAGADLAGRITAADTTQVVASPLFACVLHRDGTVECAGVNNHEQLGDGTTTDRGTFARVKGVAGAVQIAAGNFHACALLADHTVTCWGDIAMTGMGDAMSPPVAIAGLRDVVELAAGPDMACARKRDGSVACWGHYRQVMAGPRSHWYSARPVDVPWLRGATRMSIGPSHSCAVLPAGLACWGENSAGQLGDGTMDDHDAAVLVRW